MEKSPLVTSVTILLVPFTLSFLPSDLVKQRVVWLRHCVSMVFNPIQPSAIVHELESSTSLHLEQSPLLEWQ